MATFRAQVGGRSELSPSFYHFLKFLLLKIFNMPRCHILKQFVLNPITTFEKNGVGNCSENSASVRTFFLVPCYQHVVFLMPYTCSISPNYIFTSGVIMLVYIILLYSKKISIQCLSKNDHSSNPQAKGACKRGKIIKNSNVKLFSILLFIIN